MNELTTEIGNIYAKNTSAVHDARFRGLFEKHARRTEIIVKSVLYISTIYVITFMLLSTLNSVVTGKMQPTLGFFMPGVDENTTCGITLLVLHQIAISTFGMTIEIVFNATLYVVFSNMSMISAMIVDHTEELQRKLNMPKGVMCIDIDIKRQQIDLIRMHLKYNK